MEANFDMPTEAEPTFDELASRALDLWANNLPLTTEEAEIFRQAYPELAVTLETEEQNAA